MALDPIILRTSIIDLLNQVTDSSGKQLFNIVTNDLMYTLIDSLSRNFIALVWIPMNVEMTPGDGRIDSNDNRVPIPHAHSFVGNRASDFARNYYLTTIQDMTLQHFILPESIMARIITAYCNAFVIFLDSPLSITTIDDGSKTHKHDTEEETWQELPSPKLVRDTAIVELIQTGPIDPVNSILPLMLFHLADGFLTAIRQNSELISSPGIFNHTHGLL